MAFMAVHTNLDRYFSSLISRKLGLKNIKPLTEDGFGSYGRLARSVTLKELIQRLKQKLGIRHVSHTGALDKKVLFVASVGGAGSSVISSALKEKKVDALLTSDVKYHAACSAKDLDIALIQASHFDTENLMLPELKKVLDREFGNRIQFEVNPHRTDPVEYD
jgi:putative NIF3 family GTP cyclohydrolase 1 type 2